MTSRVCVGFLQSILVRVKVKQGLQSVKGESVNWNDAQCVVAGGAVHFLQRLPTVV
jgi:hypothetical protein